MLLVEFGDVVATDAFPSESSQVSASQAVSHDISPHEREASMDLVGVGTVSVWVIGGDGVAVVVIVVETVSVMVPLLTVGELEGVAVTVVDWLAVLVAVAEFEFVPLTVSDAVKVLVRDKLEVGPVRVDVTVADGDTLANDVRVSVPCDAVTVGKEVCDSEGVCVTD